MKKLFVVLGVVSALLCPGLRADGDDGDGSKTNVTVSVTASDPVAFASLSTGAFVLYRNGTNGDLAVSVSYSGSASNGVDYVTLPTTVTIPAGLHAVGLVVQPLTGGSSAQSKTVVLTLAAADAYQIVREPRATVTIKFNAFENQAPTIAITSPADNTSIAAHSDLPITATVSDDSGNPKVSFYANDHFLGTLKAPPYSITWSNVPAGKFALFARAEDGFGKSTISSPVHVISTNPPPPLGKITITSPADESTFTAGANIDISAKVEGNSNIVSVVFLANGVSIGSVGTSPYSITWSNVLAGHYELRARGIDVSGAVINSQDVDITVKNPSPTVTVTSPADKSTVSAGDNVSVEASASSPNGPIDNVMFFIDEHFLGKTTNSPYSMIWSNVPPGIHSIRAKATDSIGATATSPAILITVTNPPSTVAITAPLDGATVPPGKLTLTADASDPNGIRRVNFWSGRIFVGSSDHAPYTVTVPVLLTGTYEFAAEAIDTFGGSTRSAAIHVNVARTAPAP